MSVSTVHIGSDVFDRGEEVFLERLGSYVCESFQMVFNVFVAKREFHLFYSKL